MSFFNNSSPSVSTIGLGTKSDNLVNDQDPIPSNNQYTNQYNNDKNFETNNNNNIQDNNDNILQNNNDNTFQNNSNDQVQYRNNNNNNLQNGSLPKIQYSLPLNSINQPEQKLSPGLIATIVIVPIGFVFLMLLICRQRFSSRTSKFDQTSSASREHIDGNATSRGMGIDIPDGETRSERIRRMMSSGRNRRHSRSDSVSTVPEYSLNPIESEMTISSSELNANTTVQTSLFSRFINGLHYQSPTTTTTPPPPDYEINSSQSEQRAQLSRTPTNSSSTPSTSTSNSSIFTFSSSTHSHKSTTRSNTVSYLPSLDQASVRTDQANEDNQIHHHSNSPQLEVHPFRTQSPFIRPLDQISPLTSFINLNNTPFPSSPPFTGQSNPNHSTSSIH